MTNFKEYLVPGKKGHLIGIGGVSMSPLAEVLHDAGLTIVGSDMHEGDNTQMLRSKGIKVSIGHCADNITDDLDFIVRTAAVHDDNPEVVAAHEKGIPVFERTQAWGAIMRKYPNAICISGTHGKTTTTSMCTHIMMAAERDPTVHIGGTLPLLHSGHRIGKGDTIIFESCEYYNSFLSLTPTIAVILNIEADHLDFFKDLADIQNSFRAFADRVPRKGTIIANLDDKNTMDALRPLGRELLTFGLSPEADIHPENIVRRGAKSEFDIISHGKFITRAVIHIPGMHNIRNALAAAAAALCLGVSPAAVKYGLSGFQGAGRRFEFKGKFNGADLYDDYAHHPSELRAVLDAVDALDYTRTIVVFQPHTYTRTQALFQDFVEQLRRPTITYLAEIYAARERNTIGISSADLAKEIPGAQFYPTFAEIEQSLALTAKPGDIILTIGAGDVFRIGDHLMSIKQH